MARVQNNTLSAEEEAGLFTEVSEALTDWTKLEPDSNTTVKYSIRGFLRRHLRRTSFRSLAETVEISSKTSTCDLTVNEQIGIKIIHDLYDGSKHAIHKQIRPLLQEFEYLIIYGHQISVKYTDTWRQIKRSLNRYADDKSRLHMVVTVKGGQYTIPLTNTSVAKTIVWKYGIYSLFFAFIFLGSRLVEGTNDGNMMGGAFIWAIIVFNVVVLLLALFLVRNL